MKWSREVIDARREKIVSYMEANANETITGLEIANKIGVSRFVIQNDMKAIEKEYPELSITHRGYVWVMNEKKENPMRNCEGYYDPTAGQALKNLEKSSTYDRPWKPGEVWEAASSRGNTDLLLVVSVGGDTSCCLMLYNYDDSYVNKGRPENLKHIAWTTHDYIVDASKIGQKPNKYFERRVFTLPLSMFTEIKAMIARCLDIDGMIEKPVEKIVEKEVKVEVPVEKTVYVEVPGPGTGKYTEEELETKLLEQRIDIYERILKFHGYVFDEN